MSIQLQPREYFTVVRQLQDHTDSTTYYVQATIRDARTDALLEVLALTDQGNRRFSKPWQVVSDPSGLGRYISVLSEVFTDSGYTSKASTYGDELETHLILERTIHSGGSSNLGGGTGIDYKRIKKMIDDAIKDIPQVKIPEYKYPDLSPINRAILDLQDAISAIEMPQFPAITPTDLQPVIFNIKEAQTTIMKALGDIPGRDKNDIMPLADELKNLDLKDLKAQITSSVDDMTKLIESLSEFTTHMPEWRSNLKDVSEKLKDIVFAMALSGRKAEEKPKQTKDFTKIVSRMRKI